MVCAQAGRMVAVAWRAAGWRVRALDSVPVCSWVTDILAGPVLARNGSGTIRRNRQCDLPRRNLLRNLSRKCYIYVRVIFAFCRMN